MRKTKAIAIIIAAAGSKQDTIKVDDKDQYGNLPFIEKISCTDNLAALIGKLTIELKHVEKSFPIFDGDLDLYYLTSAFEEKFRPEIEGGQLQYTVRNADVAQQTVHLVLELRYP